LRPRLRGLPRLRRGRLLVLTVSSLSKGSGFDSAIVDAINWIEKKYGKWGISFYKYTLKCKYIFHTISTYISKYYYKIYIYITIKCIDCFTYLQVGPRPWGLPRLRRGRLLVLRSVSSLSNGSGSDSAIGGAINWIENINKKMNIK